MSKKSYREAIRDAIASEMRRDPRVVVMGEDNAGGAGAPGEKDAWGGVLGVTKGLQPEFGPDRVLDTPITESAFIGAAAGAAATGLRPVAELMFVDFMGVCFDQIFNQAAKFRYMFGGKAVTPLVIRTMYGAGFRAASQHSQCLYPLFTHIPGLKVVLPSSPYEAKGLMIQSIRDDDPVIFFEHKLMYDETADVPDDTGRLVVVDEATPRCGMACDISALVAQEAFGALRAPIEMVTAPHTPVPFAQSLEALYIPDAQKVANAVKKTMDWKK